VLSDGRPFDRFEVRVEVAPPKRRLMGLLKPSRASVKAVVRINGEEATPDWVDVEALLEAAHDGTVFPYACAGCGVAGCAGYSHGVHLFHSGGQTLWADQDAREQWVFETAAFLTELRKLEVAVADAQAKWPDVLIQVEN
jgi:hypothetical protein